MMQSIHRACVSLAACGTLLLAAHPAAAQNQHWIRQLGTNADESVEAAAADASGGVYIGGDADGSLFGPNAGMWDSWLARYDAAGVLLWGRQLGSIESDLMEAAGADGSGGVFIGGRTYGSLGGSSAGGIDGWLARYDPSGNQLWIRQLGTSAWDELQAAEPDGSGGVFVGGFTYGNLGGLSAGSGDAWLARYDGAGNQLWVRQLGTGLPDAVFAAAVDGTGGVYVSGSTDASLGGPSAGATDAWLARYDGAGNQVWIRQLGSSAMDYSFTAAADGSGGVFVGGHTYGSLGGPFAGGTDDAWIAHYDGTGNLLWIRQLGTSGNESAGVSASDGSGGVFVCGSSSGNLGGQSAGGYDAWFARYDGAGNQLSIRRLGTALTDYCHAAASDGAGGVFVGGSTSGNLGGQGAGLGDAWVARYGPSLPLLCEPGQGGVIGCPCSNPASGPGRGCDNSSATGGASLSAAGEADLSADTLVFTAQDEKPTALSVLLQGTSAVSQGLVFGQGVRCAGGTLRRLYVHAAVGGAVTMPDVSLGDPSVSARSAALGDTIPPGQSRWYSVYYRDPIVSGGCPAASTFNTGPTMRAVWAP